MTEAENKKEAVEYLDNMMTKVVPKIEENEEARMKEEYRTLTKDISDPELNETPSEQRLREEVKDNLEIDHENQLLDNSFKDVTRGQSPDASPLKGQSDNDSPYKISPQKYGQMGDNVETIVAEAL